MILKEYGIYHISKYALTVYMEDVLYRQAIMRKPPNNGVRYIIDLAEITIPGGIIRGIVLAGVRTRVNPWALCGCHISTAKSGDSLGSKTSEALQSA
jgi:hypothetical protein